MEPQDHSGEEKDCHNIEQRNDAEANNIFTHSTAGLSVYVMQGSERPFDTEEKLSNIHFGDVLE